MKAVFRPAAIAALIAAVGNALVWYVGTLVSGPMAVVVPEPMDVGVAQVLGSSFVFAMLGTTVVAFIALRTRQPQRTWVILTVVGLVLYGVMPFAATPSLATALWFNVMHAVAGALLIPAVAKVLPSAQ